MSRIFKSIALGFLIFLFFCLMSRMDFIVHGILYNYGLHFSYEWALGYWITYSLSFVAFSIAVSFSYWVGSGKTVKDLKLSIALLITVNALMLGGIQDIMFFVFWAGGLPPNNVVWWWAPWTYVVGTWTSLTQIGFTVLMVCSTILMWILVVRKIEV